MHHARLASGTRHIRVLACDGGMERLRGLLGRPEPEPGVALLLEPCWAVHTLGMRYSIDVVFCDERWRVLRVVSALRPRRAVWMRGAVRVLELAAHTARPLGLVAGARLQPDARLEPPARTRAAQGADPVPAPSVPLRALAGLAAVTVLAALLLGGCVSARPELREAPTRDELRLQAEIDYASRAWVLAEAGYRELLRHEPREADHWQRLGVVFLSTGRSREAVESLEAAARLRAPDARTLQNLALAHLHAAVDALDAAAAHGETRASASELAALHAATPERESLRVAARAVEALLPPDLRRAHQDTPR